MRGSRGLLAFCGLAAVLSCLAVTAPAAADLVEGAYYIAPNGNNSTGNGSFGNPWRTLGGAIYNIRRICGGAVDDYTAPITIEDDGITTIYVKYGANGLYEPGEDLKYTDGNNIEKFGDPRVLIAYLGNTEGIRIIGLKSGDTEEATCAADGPTIRTYFQIDDSSSWDTTSPFLLKESGVQIQGTASDVIRTESVFSSTGWTYGGMIRGYIEYDDIRYSLINYATQRDTLQDLRECYPSWNNLFTSNVECGLNMPLEACLNTSACGSGSCVESFPYNGTYVGPGIYHEDDMVGQTAGLVNPIDSSTQNRLYVRLAKGRYMTDDDNGPSGTEFKAQSIGFDEDFDDYPTTIAGYESMLRNTSATGPKVFFRANQAYFEGRKDKPLTGVAAPDDLEVRGLTFDGMHFAIAGTEEDPATGITLKGVRIRGGNVQLTKAEDVTLDDVSIEGSHPWWATWHDVKSRRSPATSLEYQAVYLSGCKGVEISNCHFSRRFDGINAYYGSSDVIIRDCEFEDIVDDCVQLASTSYDVHIYRNKMVGSGSSVSKHFIGEPGALGEAGAPSEHIGEKYIHHNIIDQVKPLQWGRPMYLTPQYSSTEDDREVFMDVFGQHGAPYEDTPHPRRQASTQEFWRTIRSWLEKTMDRQSTA